jgi:NAD(P)-dependent dehydrogenase (short-subunit alcohol dehydrogenase family)
MLVLVTSPLFIHTLGNATVYLACRSAEKGFDAIRSIQTDERCKSSNGKLEFLELDLASLESVKRAADEFLKREQRLDVLVLNA